jgi:hypothetical protein
VTEDEFCRIGQVPTASVLKQQYHALRDLLARYRCLREDHVRYLVKCGLPAAGPAQQRRHVLRLSRSRDRPSGNEGLDRRRVVSQHRPRHDGVAPGSARARLPARRGTGPSHRAAAAGSGRQNSDSCGNDSRQPRRTIPRWRKSIFRAASALDDGDESTMGEAAADVPKGARARSLPGRRAHQPAQHSLQPRRAGRGAALYERAIGLESDFFEAHFNLGNIYHDLGRFTEAQACYREALRLNPFYADAHFYLAVTFEKMGQSQEARPHWRAYTQLAPHGEWVELAKEFSE